MEINRFLEAVKTWAAEDARLESVLLVGSHARGTNHAASDVDLMILTAAKDAMLRDQSWAARFGRVKRSRVESYGACTSVRVWYENGPEVEYGLVPPSWAGSPLDPGTARVLRDGYRVLQDRAGHFAAPEIPPLA